MISCCLCKLEFEKKYRDRSLQCDATVHNGKIHGHYFSDFDELEFEFIKQEIFTIRDNQRVYSTMSKQEVEKMFTIYDHQQVCNPCIYKLIKQNQIVCTNEAFRYNPCALCGNEKPELFFYNNKVFWFYPRNMDETWYKGAIDEYTELPFTNPIHNGIKMLTDNMSLCETCFFFYK